MKSLSLSISLSLSLYKIYSKKFTRVKPINFYELLLLDKFASILEVENAYFNIKKNHYEDKELMNMVNLAYDTLGNTVNKDLYDAFIENDPAYDEWNYKGENRSNKMDNRENQEYNNNNWNYNTSNQSNTNTNTNNIPFDYYK